MKLFKFALLCLGLIGSLVNCAAVPDLEGRVYRQQYDRLELTVRSQISVASKRIPQRCEKSGFLIEPDDRITYWIYLKNISKDTVRVVTGTDFGFRSFGSDFRYSCVAEYFEGAHVRMAPAKLDIVDLKPGELAMIGTVQYICQNGDAGENSFMYSIADAVGDEYGVWAGSILCRASFCVREQKRP